MTTTAVQPLDDTRRDELVATLTTDGIIGLKGAFEPAWADRLNEDVLAAFEEARSREGGAIVEPQRWYVEIPGADPRLRRPRLAPVARADRDRGARRTTRSSRSASTSRSPAPWTSPGTRLPDAEETRREGRLTSLAVNVTCVDTTTRWAASRSPPATQYRRQSPESPTAVPAPGRSTATSSGSDARRHGAGRHSSAPPDNHRGRTEPSHGRPAGAGLRSGRPERESKASSTREGHRGVSTTPGRSVRDREVPPIVEELTPSRAASTTSRAGHGDPCEHMGGDGRARSDAVDPRSAACPSCRRYSPECLLRGAGGRRTADHGSRLAREPLAPDRRARSARRGPEDEYYLPHAQRSLGDDRVRRRLRVSGTGLVRRRTRCTRR
jgi:hypothetical protein